VRKLFADLINAAADDVAFAPAVSYGMAQAAHNIPIRRTQRVVTLSEQFPSNVYPWMDLAERTGAAFVSVPRPGDDDWTSALLSFIDGSTGIVAVPQVSLDRRRAHRPRGDRGCVSQRRRRALRGCHPVGRRAAARRETDRSGFCRRRQLQMAARTVQSRISLRCAALATRSPHRAQLDRARGLRGFRRPGQLLPRLSIGRAPFRRRRAQQLCADARGRSLAQADLQWTVPRISETLRLRTRAIAERARAEFAIASVPDQRRAGHYLGLRFSGGVPPDLPKRLAAANVYVSVRGQAMRVTPHVWNTDDDVEKLFAVLKAELFVTAWIAGAAVALGSPARRAQAKP